MLLLGQDLMASLKRRSRELLGFLGARRTETTPGSKTKHRKRQRECRKDQRTPRIPQRTADARPASPVFSRRPIQVPGIACDLMVALVGTNR